MFSLQVRQTRVAALLGVFGGSAMLWVFWTSGCYAFVFQQPIGIGPEIRLAWGAYHLTENFGNSGWKVNGKVTFRKFQPKIEEYVLR